MRPPHAARRTIPAALAAALLLSGCGVRPTGVLDGGTAASGLTKGLRLYFVSQAGRLEAVSRPDMPASKVTDPAGVIKLLGQGPTAAERASGLTSLVRDEDYEMGYEADVDDGGAVTVRVPQFELDDSSVGDRNLTGQLVCSIARARAMAESTGTADTDDIRVTVRPREGRAGTHVCSDFLK
ncbi:GerMN domain-containing protein [Streptomyces aureocirculatus]|uniref:GerMN domain-containing protein n=1 Tax=Streptomyces aureocirculatus TaxID=67275 RepID=UPI0004C6C40A|nr:GerMN domain-containing protein [Streptomyces aureocirculatus]